MNLFQYGCSSSLKLLWHLWHLGFTCSEGNSCFSLFIHYGFLGPWWVYQSMCVLTQVTLLDPLTTVDGGAPVWVKVVQFDLIAALKECEGDWRAPFEKWMLQNCTDSCLNMQLSHDSVTSASGVFNVPQRNQSFLTGKTTLLGHQTMLKSLSSKRLQWHCFFPPLLGWETTPRPHNPFENRVEMNKTFLP